jgi:hypothetical protein
MLANSHVRWILNWTPEMSHTGARTPQAHSNGAGCSWVWRARLRLVSLAGGAKLSLAAVSVKKFTCGAGNDPSLPVSNIPLSARVFTNKRTKSTPVFLRLTIPEITMSSADAQTAPTAAPTTQPMGMRKNGMTRGPFPVALAAQY